MARRILVWLRAIPIALVLGIALYGGLVEAGVVSNPFAPVARGELGLARSDKPGLRVLFVGNSFTYENDMPELVHRLGGETDPIFAVSFTAGGWRLQNFDADRELDRLLREVRWNVVVLQEQSEIPSFDPIYRAKEFDPYVRRLTQKISASGARPLLFLTWGYRNGDSRNLPEDTFAAMQTRLYSGYWDAARSTGTAVAPVGLAWSEAVATRPQLDLWAGDGRHPSRLGSYLAACVFYATLTGQSPVGSTFTDGLNEPDARFLQGVAWDIARKQY